MDIWVSDKFPCISGQSPFFYTKLSSSESQFFGFLSVVFFLLSFMNFAKKYAPISEILDASQRTGCRKLLCIRHYALFYTINYGPRKTQNFDL